MLPKIIYSLIGLLWLLPIQLHATQTPYHYHFSSMEKLMQEEVGRSVLTDIYQSIGINIQVSPLAPKRAEMMATTGVLDGEVMRIWEYGIEHSTALRVPTPFYRIELIAYTLAHREIVIRDKDDLKKYKVATVRGVKHSQDIDMLYHSNSAENMFKLLKNEQVDVALINRLDGQVAFKKLAYNGIIATGKPIEHHNLFHYIHKKHKELIPRVNDAIMKLKVSGRLTTLIKAAELKVINAQ